MKPRPPSRKYACAPASSIGSKVQTGITTNRQGVGRSSGTVSSPLGNIGTPKTTRAQFSKLKPMNVQTKYKKKDFLLTKKLSATATQKFRYNKKGR
jgi:hypothetical protein